MPNALAYLALLSWPLLTVVLFVNLRVDRALIWSMLGGYLLLPPVAAFDLPLVPPLDKFSITTLSAFLACAFVGGDKIPLLPTSALGRILVVAFVASPVLTVLTNLDALYFPMMVVPGLGIHDMLSAIVGQSIAITPMLLARRLLATEQAQREILVGLVVAGLLYSLPMLIEIRLSPQINTWVYGFFQHDFIQMMRQGGYRPIVFLPHGLWLAFFVTVAFLSAVALWRNAVAERKGAYMMATGYLGVLLVLCKSMAALVYGACLAPLILFGSRRLQLSLAAALALVAVSYPLLRGADLVPVEAMLARVQSVDMERAASLRFRFDNEGQLLARAVERPAFGWGGWGRNVIRDPISGEETSVNDGRWIIVIGIHGWFGYLAEFGLLALAPLLMLRQSARLPDAALSPYAGALAVILGANMIDMLPNATLVPLTWLLAGALLGYAESQARSSPAPAQANTIPGPAARPRRTIL